MPLVLGRDKEHLERLRYVETSDVVGALLNSIGVTGASRVELSPVVIVTVALLESGEELAVGDAA